MFADDTKIFREINSIEDSVILQEDLTKLLQWSNKWLLKFHPDKCISLSINKKQENEVHYKLGDHTLQAADQEKDIGVIIDKDLSFSQHMNDKINKANRIVGMIRGSFRYLTEETFLQLYKAIIRPHLEYANCIWYPCKKKDITQVENVQRRATKLIPSIKDLSYEERLKKLRLPTLTYRRARGDMIETYKMLSGEYDPEVNNLLRPSTDSATRGHSKKLFLQRAEKTVRQSYFTIRIVKLWNSLPSDVVTAPSLPSFERRFDRTMRNHEGVYNYQALLYN